MIVQLPFRSEASNQPQEPPTTKAAAKPNRIKRWTPKTVTGCFCCRSRRVKCGEEKPRCRRCIKRGDNCNYPVFRSELERAASTSTSSALARLIITPPASPDGITPSAQDKEMFYMLRLDTAERLSGWSDARFWSRDVLQASQVYPAMWYASLALAAMSRSKSKSQSHDPISWSILAMNYYSKSIKAMFETTRKKSLSYRDKESLMMTEALLVGVDSVGGSLQQATKHAANAVLLFDMWRFQRPQGERLGEAVMRRESLMTIVTALRSQMAVRFQHVAPRSTTTTTCQDDLEQALDQDPDAPFRSLTDAYEAVVPLYTSSVNATASMGMGSSVHYDHAFYASHKAALATWRGKLADLEREKPPRNKAERFGFMLMAMYAEGIEACLTFDPREGIFMWDKYAPLCYSILDRLETWLEVEGGQPYGAPFSFSTSIAESVFWTCITCRDYEFRRRAASLLRSWSVRDGLWDTRLIAGIVDTLIEVENRNGECRERILGCGCAPQTFICAAHRIVSTNIDFVAAGEARCIFSTLEDLQLGRPPRTRMLYY